MRVLREHLWQEVCIVVPLWTLRHCNCSWMVLNHFLVFVLKEFSSTLECASLQITSVPTHKWILILTESLSWDYAVQRPVRQASPFENWRSCTRQIDWLLMLLVRCDKERVVCWGLPSWQSLIRVTVLETLQPGPLNARVVLQTVLLIVLIIVYV